MKRITRKQSEEKKDVKEKEYTSFEEYLKAVYPSSSKSKNPLEVNREMIDELDAELEKALSNNY